MKRFLFAVLFFIFLLFVWQKLYDAHIWSAVLLPSPGQVANYLKEAAADGTLFHATVITMRRLLIGYAVGIVIGLPLGLITARWNLFEEVRPDRSGHVVCRYHGNSVVGRDRD